MIRFRPRALPVAFSVPVMALLMSGCATLRSSPVDVDSFNLGRNSAGDPCVASRAWSDPARPDVMGSSYFITCRGATAGRPLGALRLVSDVDNEVAPIDATMQCGDAAQVAIASGAATARQCYDNVLASNTVRLDARRGSQRLVGVAAPNLLGPLEEGMAILAGSRPIATDARRDSDSSIDVAMLAARPAGDGSTRTDGAIFDPRGTLQQGIAFNHRGLHVDASRVLNDALSRLDADADPALRAEMLLEAGLADSNISFTASAAEHFAAAEAIFSRSPQARTPILTRKINAYRALDLLNSRQYAEALQALDLLVSSQAPAGQPLLDPAIVRQLNQGVRGDSAAASALSVPDSAELSQLVLDGQANWARSVALLALGNADGAQSALTASTVAYRTLQGEPIDQAPIQWLGARIARQEGRLQAQRRDWNAAIASFDRAIALLQRSSLASAGTGTEPAIAEAQLERASIIALSDRGTEEKRTEYAAAVDALIASNLAGSALPSGMDGYFDLLVAEAETGLRDDTYERFFRALQAAGEPAVARQLSQLQNIVTADPELARKIRDRAEAEREITRLRFAITANDTSLGGVEELERQRLAAEAQLVDLDTQLGESDRFRAVDDRPASLVDIRAALQPGEGFLKVAELNRRVFGIYVTADQTFIYKIAANAQQLREVNELAANVRRSIDGRLAIDNKLVPFDAGGAHVLFRLIAGPARDAILASQAIVVDPSGPLESLPAGVLVANYDAGARRASGFDFSTTDFLAGRLTISTAVSPRSFLVARALPPSDASQPFLGFGAHQSPVGGDSGRMINVGFGCVVPHAELAELSRQFAPISERELEVAATALGAANAPMITHAAFTDTAIEARDDLADYQVLHFATHGLQEGQWGCAKSPPALVTSFGDENSDGLLSFSEVARLRLNANLVVLSACDTASGVRDESLARASGQEQAGQTLEGLVRAFLTANARAVLATYWQVSAEQESEDLIRTFYQSARSRSIGGALQAAQISLMRDARYSHPFYWAPYFVVGDSTKPMISPSATAPRVAAR